MSSFYDYALQKSRHTLASKSISPLLPLLKSLPCIDSSVQSESGIRIVAKDSAIAKQHEATLQDIAMRLKPWRKGAFYLFDTYINSEWQSFIKWRILAPHCDFSNKLIADIGCNNGYYMLEMLLHALEKGQVPKGIIGLEPNGLFKCQFDFIYHFAKGFFATHKLDSVIDFKILGIEDVLNLCQAQGGGFDMIFCLGVLYHRQNPLECLKWLYNALNKGGELILDTLILESELELVLSPSKSYAKMSNAYFIPSISALKGWCERAGFREFHLIATNPTTTNEQRKTKWIDGESLEAFLDSTQTRTIEGYQAPIRGYVKLIKS